MKYNARISVKGDAALIRNVFASEDTKIKEKASYSIKKTLDGMAFDVNAEDSVALRTALNSITKVLTVIEKTREIQ